MAVLSFILLFFFEGMIIQEDTVFVAGLPESASSKEIAEFFGKIGIIKVRFVFLLLE